MGKSARVKMKVKEPCIECGHLDLPTTDHKCRFHSNTFYKSYSPGDKK